MRFPFGFGLSYTTFTYHDLAVDSEGVTFKIKNTGDVEGTEIAQLMSENSPRQFSVRSVS